MPLDCAGISCIGESICEMDRDSVAARVPIDDVKRVTLGHGFQSPHPRLQTALGVALMIPGAWAIFHVLHWAFFGGTFIIYEAGLFGFAIGGLYMMATARRRGLYFDIETREAPKRLAFRQNPSREELLLFLETLDQHLAVPIRSNVPKIPYANSRG